MAQTFIIPDMQAGWIGNEITFGTLASPMVRADLVGKAKVTLAPVEVENKTATVNGFDVVPPEVGLFGGTVEFTSYLRPPLVAISGAAAVPTQNHPLGITLKALMGGESYNSGSAVAAVSTTTAVTVSSGHGTRFPQGSVVGVQTSNGIEWGYVTSRATDVLTVAPAFGATPVTSGAVVNSYTYYPTETNNQSLSFQLAYTQDATNQWQAVGCTGDFDIVIKEGEFPTVSTKLTVASGSGPASLGLSAATYTSLMSSPMVVNNAQVVFAATTDTTRTQYGLEECTIKINNGMTHVAQMGAGAVEGKGLAARTKLGAYAEATLKFRSDTVIDTSYWTNRTNMQLWVAWSKGAGTSKRWDVVGLPTCYIVGKPVYDNSGNHIITTVTVRADVNSLIANPSSDLERAPMVLAVL